MFRAALLWAFVLTAADLPKRPIQLSDLPAELRTVSEANAFNDLRRRIEQDTTRRVSEGQQEHLIYFILQSAVFTKKPRIEPALSARTFIEGGSRRPPADVTARMRDFLRALEHPAMDSRLSFWKSHLPAERRSLAALADAYAGSMRFLYQKEFAPGEQASSTVYQRRGHSVDTQVEANYAVATALAVIHEIDPNARLERVLIVGPGLDLAPRTGYRDDVPPQSYQPYLTADALLRLKLADAGSLSVHCVDINPQVVDFIESFPSELKLPRFPGDRDYEEWFQQAGRGLGPVAEESSGKTVRIIRDAALRIRAGRLNILTERYDPSPAFDLVIATNVLLYFSHEELPLALANIGAMMRPGGYFVHNELRPQMESIAKALSLPPIQGRTLQLGQGQKRPLFDVFVIHRAR